MQSKVERIPAGISLALAWRTWLISLAFGAHGAMLLVKLVVVNRIQLI